MQSPSDQLPIFENASACEVCRGTCCKFVFKPLFAIPHGAPGQGEDYMRLMAAPPEAQKLYHARQNFIRKYGDQNRPCCWFDEATSKCRFYAFRPQVCRDFEVGGEGCLEVRNENTLLATIPENPTS